MTQPTLHVTNWSSRKLHGPGRKWTIMARPRWFEKGHGSVPLLTPNPLVLLAVQNGAQSIGAYREGYESYVEGHADDLEPGRLKASIVGWPITISDGDTLCCACSRAKAAAGECHRAWAAEALVRAGWRVVLDGEVLEL